MTYLYILAMVPFLIIVMAICLPWVIDNYIPALIAFAFLGIIILFSWGLANLTGGL